MTVKKDSLGNIASASLEIAYKCGECLHHSRHAHPSFQTPCNKRGIRTFAIAPKCFTPDVTQVAKNSDTFVQLAALLSEYTPKEKRIMLAILKQKPIKRQQFRKDMQFGTKVYFLGMGKDYISNYLAGFVLGQTSSGELILTGSPDRNTRGRSYVAYMQDSDSLMTAKEWKVKKAELKAKGRIHDPASVIVPKGTTMPAEPVTIDSAPQAWHDKQEKKKKKNKGPSDLVFKIS